MRCGPDGRPGCDARPGTPGREVCNAVDDDCDGLIDEGVETCNGADDDCDGAVDEEPDGTICPDFEDNPGSGVRACQDARCVIARCSPGRVDLDDGLNGEPVGYRNGCETACTPSAAGIDVCVGGRPDCMDNCDGQDDDCDGVVDEGEEATRPGVCSNAPFRCDGAWSEPDYAEVIAEYEADEVTCDGLDNDCDGDVDEGLVACDNNCDGIDDDDDGSVDEVQACADTTCAADTRLPPCNGCPEGTIIPGRDPVGGEWVCVPAGVFTLGSPDGEEGRNDDEGPQVPVVITRPLLVQAHETTQGQWRAVFGTNPSHSANCGEACPVEQVNWFEAVAYVNRLSTDAGLEPCYALDDCAREPGEDMECAVEVARAPVSCTGYRLPTEAEWEYFACADTDTGCWSGDTEADLARVGWYGSNSDRRTHPVCALPAEPPHHPWGLCDVYGNVWEWTESWYGPYPAPPADGAPFADPLGPPRGASRVIRGGSFVNDARSVRAANRNGWSPRLRDWAIGFRPVRFAGPAPRVR